MQTDNKSYMQTDNKRQSNFESANQSIAQKKSTSAKSYACPTCHSPTQWHNNPNKPFCSKHCKLIDFGAWANEDYKL